MNSNPRTHARKKGEESGAALVMVLLISFLLGTACVAMLTAAGASARNSTDVLSETKAFYAAESGIQAAVNALRYGGTNGGPVNYKQAVNYFANSGDLSTWLSYSDCDATSGPDRVRIANQCDNAYKITVTDPDNSQSSLTYATGAAQFRAVLANGAFGSWGSSRVFGSAGSGNETTLSWVPNPTNPTTLSFDADNPYRDSLIGSLRLTNGATGGTPMDTATEFRVFYQLAIPGNPGWMIMGTVQPSGAISLQSRVFVITGSRVDLNCPNAGTCQPLNPTTTGGATSTVPINGRIDPKEPHRLLVKSTGYGPNRSQKMLEAVLQKSPLDGMNSVSPFTMLGGCGSTFQAGTSNTTTYTGVSSGGVVAPAFAFTNSCNLNTANTWIAQHLTPNGQNQAPQVNPPPAQFEAYQLPEWQRTPQQMDAKVQIYRAQAQYSGTYYNPHPGPKITDPGYVAGQTGPITTVTFCEGNCTVDGNRGGGILVVTGKLTSLGGFGFRGLILVTGPQGWERAGGGCGEIIGNVVIAPYTSADLTTNVFSLPPVYQITGAGCSGVEYAGLDDLFQGENSAMTNFIRGVAEK